MRSHEGSAAPQVLAVLVLLAAGLAGLGALLGAGLDYQRRSRDAEAGRELLLRRAWALLDRMKADPSPEADSPLDPVWLELKKDSEDLSVSLRDLSSALNPNFVRKGILEKTRLGELLVPGTSAADLQQFREDEGLSTDIAHYAAFFQTEALPYLSAYGWANVNTTDEFALRSLYRSLSGSESAAEVFHGKIQGLLAERRIVGSAEFASVFGSDAELISPVINAEPSLNVHFLDGYILGELLSYPDYQIEEPAHKAAALLSLRESRELSQSDLVAALGVPENHVLLHYLGVRTWFWEIVVESPRGRLRLVVARDPRDEGTDSEEKVQFIEIERRFEG